MGWPTMRINGWWREVCVCRWFRQASDLVEPWLFLPSIFLYMWVFTMLKQAGLPLLIEGILAVILTVAILFVFCIILVWSQGKDEKYELQ